MTGADARLVEAQALINAQRYTDAVGLLQSHLGRNPDDSDAVYLLGLAAYGSGDDDLAVTTFERSVRADPDNEFAEFGLMMTLRQQQRPERQQQRSEREQQRSEPAPTPAERGPVPDNRPRRLALAVGLALALTVAVVVVVLVLLPGQKRFDPIQVSDSPDGVAVARGVVWVTSRDGAVTRIQPDEPSTKRIGLGIGKNLDSVAIGEGSVWVTDEGVHTGPRDEREGGKVARLDEDSGSVGEPITVGGRPKGLAVGGGAVWVADCQGRVIRIPLESGSRRSRPIDVKGYPRSVAVARGRVYVAVRPAYGDDCGRVRGARGYIAILDISGNKKARRLKRIGDPSDIAFTEDWLWVADASRNRVLRVDPDTGDFKGKPLRVNSSLTAVAADEDGVWALSRRPTPTGKGTLTRIDPATGKRVGKPIAIADNPQEVAVESGRVWVTQAATDKVTPIKP